MTRVLGLSLYGPQAASHRIRLSQFTSGLASNGIHLEIQSLLGDDYLKQRFSGKRVFPIGLLKAYWDRICVLLQSQSYDLAIVHCELLAFMPSFLELALLKIPFIYDYDDAFYLKYRQPQTRLFCSVLGNKTDRILSAARAVTAGNSVLAAYAQPFNSDVTLLPSVVDTDHIQPRSRLVDRHDQPFTVGWIGSPSTAVYLQQLIEPLREFACQRPVRLAVVGGPAPDIPGVDIVEYAWSLDTEDSLIQQFDVGVMPLPDTPWARGKCAFKLIKCMASAIPVIASPVGANSDVLPSSCGLLASSSDQWLTALRELDADPQLRYTMGCAGRARVEQHYSVRSVLPTLIDVIRRVSYSHS